MDRDQEKSKSQLKREATALQKIGQRLSGLSDDQLQGMHLPEELMQAIRMLRSMTSHGARRRQMQFIGALMRGVDTTPISQALLEIDQGSHRQAKRFHRLECWRDRMVDGDDAAMMEILERFPQADRQRLGQLVRSARREKQKNAAPKSARNLFRYLDELLDD